METGFVLAAICQPSDFGSDGFYTGKSYIYQGGRFAVVESSISKAKVYKSKKRAESICDNIDFENYRFEVQPLVKEETK